MQNYGQMLWFPTHVLQVLLWCILERKKYINLWNLDSLRRHKLSNLLVIQMGTEFGKDFKNAKVEDHRQVLLLRFFVFTSLKHFLLPWLHPHVLSFLLSFFHIFPFQYPQVYFFWLLWKKLPRFPIIIEIVIYRLRSMTLFKIRYVPKFHFLKIPKERCVMTWCA